MAIARDDFAMTSLDSSARHRLLAILAADVAGYSRLMSLDEARTVTALDQARSLFRRCIDEHDGRVVDTAGDSVLAVFDTAIGAVTAAVQIQSLLERQQLGVRDERCMRFRVGIHLGDVIEKSDGTVYGDGVNIAARLEGLAEPGGIAVSEMVHGAVRDRMSLSFEDAGDQNVKNIARPVRSFVIARSVLKGTPTSVEDVRHEHKVATPVICFEDFELDTARFELRRAGQRIPIEPQAFDLLVLLARNHDRTVTKEEVFSTIWAGRVVSDAALSSQVKAARRALGDDGASQRIISTVHGRGFRFLMPAEHREARAGETGLGTEPPAEAATPVQARPSVAVLPLANLNRDPDEDYLADGISEDITTALSKHRWLTVVARNPAFAFRHSTDGMRTIGQKLHADYLVTGSVRKAGTRFRITVQVVDAATESSVWSERFDRNVTDIFELQDDISERVAARIEAELGLSEQRKAERRPRKNLGAWDLYQLGAVEFYKFTAESNQSCQELLRRSIAIDPDFAGAHSRLAYAIVLSMVYFDAPNDPALMDSALAAAERATELDDEDANAYFTLGRVRLARREYDLAIDALTHAVELNPCLAVTYCGLGDSLAYEGRLDEAIQQFETAIQLSPHDPFRWAFYSYRSLAHLFQGEFQAAASWARKAVQIPNAQYWARAHLVAALGHLGDHGQAQSALQDLLRVKPGFSLAFAKERLFYLKREEQLESYLSGLRKAGVT